MLTDFVSSCLEGIFQVTLKLGFPSYAVAIIVIAVVIRMVLLPLNLKQLRSSIAMQQIQPQLQEIQNKYGKNPEAMNQKTMELYQNYNINPFAGCLPTLIQFPILIGIYQGLRAFVPSVPEYYRFFWISDLSQVDTTYIMVLLVGASTLLQSYIISGRPKQPMQWYMLIVMPLMMAWMAAKFPAFLCIYWLAVTVVGILQQLVITKPVKAMMEQREQELAEERRQQLEKQRGKGNKAQQAKAERQLRRERKSAESENAAAEDKPENGPKKNRRRRR